MLAAGLGTRMNSAQAKVLHCLAGRPLITYPLVALGRIGVRPVVVVVGYQAEAVREVCVPYEVTFALQVEQRGTGHATLAAHAALTDFHGDLLLIYGDLPFLQAETLQQLITVHQQAHAAVSLLTETVDAPAGFGRIIRDEHGCVARIVEDRDCSKTERTIREINVGVYCADADFLFPALQRLEPVNAQGELYLTDIVAVARTQGAPIADARATAGEAVQISSRSDLAAREKTLQAQINQRWMAAGVTFEDPDSTYVGPDVEIGRDTIIGPNVKLRGATRIGEKCRLDGTALITDAVIAHRSHIKFGVVITEAVLDEECQVGPFAQLRPGTHLGPRVHIGDFVEAKNAAVGAGTKAMHLAYLGDAQIGENTNIGAGTITCNYDGFRKHRTVIGHRVQVGSDSQLVAPVRVGDDAYIATGTTVRKDVPAGALVFNSRDQLQRAGWVAVRRAREAAAPRRRGAGPGETRQRPRPRPTQGVPRPANARVIKRPARAGTQGAVRRKKRPRSR